MNLAEFLDAVMPTVGELCGTDGCGEWADHVCANGTCRCDRHCLCVNKTDGKG